MFKSVNGHWHILLYFLNRHENEIPLRIVGNLKSISGFIKNYMCFVKEVEGPNSNCLDFSYNLMCVIIPYFIIVVLQDAHHWNAKHPTYFYSKHVSLCINHINDIEMRAITHKCIDQSAINVMKL